MYVSKQLTAIWQNVLSVFHDRTNAIVQHLRPTQKTQRSIELLRVARRSSTNHSTQQSALTQKYWQNTSYQLGRMNNWLYAVFKQSLETIGFMTAAVMTISSHWFNICSHIWEEKSAFLPPGYAPMQQWLVAMWQVWGCRPRKHLIWPIS